MPKTLPVTINMPIGLLKKLDRRRKLMARDLGAVPTRTHIILVALNQALTILKGGK